MLIINLFGGPGYLRGCDWHRYSFVATATKFVEEGGDVDQVIQDYLKLVEAVQSYSTSVDHEGKQNSDEPAC